MIDSLKNHFPDARIIYLVRNPLQVIPSYVSMLQGQAEVLDDQISKKTISNYVIELARHWYTYPLERLEKLPKSSYSIIRLEDLSQDVKKTVKKIYKKFNLSMTEKFSKKLDKATKKSRRHKSKHDYSLVSAGLTKDEILTEFKDIFERFGFSKHLY